MKYLLHGDDITSSRKFLTGLVSAYKVTIFDGKNLDVPALEEALRSKGLFFEKEAVIVENLISRNNKKKDILKWLSSWKGSTLLILWEDKKLTKTTVKMLNDVKIEEFLLPTYYFQFLDKLAPHSRKEIFVLYHKLLSTYAPEQLLFSIIKRTRLLVVISQNGVTEEIKKMEPWMLSKLRQQVRMWNQDELLVFYKALQDAEIRLKTGRLPTELSKHLDILILTKL